MISQNKLKKLDFEKLENFYQVFKEGSISKAAKKVGKPRHSFYYDLSALEKFFGTRLYFSGKKTFILTEEGKRLAEFCKETLNSLELITNQKSEYAEGEIIIHTTVSMGLYCFPPALQAFQEKFPKIKIKLMSGPEYINSSQQDFDLRVGPFLGNRSDLLQYALGEFEYGYFASRTYINRYGEPLSETDLKDHAFLCYSGDHFVPPTIIKNARSLIESNSYMNLYELCILDRGIGSLPLGIYKELIKDQREKYSHLVRILPNIISERATLYFSFSRSSPKEKPIRELVEILKDICQKFSA